MSNNYELPPTPPSGGNGVELSPLEKIFTSILEDPDFAHEDKARIFLCPFRKTIIFMDCDEKDSWPTRLEQAYYLEEDFLPCLKERCAMWHSIDDFGFCGMQS